MPPSDKTFMRMGVDEPSSVGVVSCVGQEAEGASVADQGAFGSDKAWCVPEAGVS